MTRVTRIMNRMMRMITVIGLLAFCPTMARAEVFLEIFDADIVATPGTGLDLTGAIQNTGLETVYLTGLSTSATEEYAQDDAFQSFVDTAPPTLGPLERWEGTLMRVELAPTAPTSIDIISLSVHGGAHAYSGDILATGYFVINDPVTVAGVEPDPAPPARPALSISPNPFADLASLRLLTAGTASIEVTIYDSQGRNVRQLLNTTLDGGEHAFQWDGQDDSGRTLPGGFYFIRVRSASLGLNLKSKVLFLGR